MTHTIGSKIEHFFSTWHKENVSFLVWLKEYFFLTQCMTQRINWSFLENMTQRIEPFFNLTLRIEPSFLNVTQRIEHFLKVTQRIVFFFSIWLYELNPLFWICLNELNPFVDWLRELNPVFFFSIWLKDLILFKNMTFKNWTFWKYESKDWTFESVTQSTEPSFSIESTNQTHFSNMSQRNEFFFLNMTHKTQRIETSCNKWLEELNFFEEKTWPTELWTIFSCDSRNWTLLSNMSHRNWTFLFFMTQRIEPFFLNMIRRMNLFSWIWRKDWSFSLKFWQNQRIEPSFQKWLKELNFLLQLCLIELIFFLKNDSKKWFFSIWLKELNFLFDSKNWTSFANFDSQM